MTTASLSMLFDQLAVKAVDDGLLAVTVVLPAELVGEYCRFLESMAGFFRVVKRKSVAATAERRAAARMLDAELDNCLAAYRQRLVSSYDVYTAAGLRRQDAIKRIAGDLRREAHPWCSADLVRVSLAAAGRRGRPGRPPSPVS